jgi:arylsulfatase A-like enzyme
VSDLPCAFWDFLPTAAELAGTTAPGGIDGMSIAPTLRGEAQRAHEHLYWEFHEGGFHQAVRQGEWKLMRQGPELELFNLRDDIGESRNVAARYPDVVARMEPLFRMLRTESAEFPIGRPERPPQAGGLPHTTEANR